MSVSQFVFEMTLNPSQGAVLNIRKSDLLGSGELRYYAIMISEMDCQSNPEVMWNACNPTKNWPSANTWYDVKDAACQPQYQATPKWFAKGLADRSSADEDSESLEIPIGGDSCPDVDKDQQFHCNGPLKAGTKYAVVLRAFSESGFADNPFVVLETISEVNFLLIILSLVAVLSLAFLLGIILVIRKKSYSSEQGSRSDALRKKSSCGAGEIATKNFPVHFEVLSRNNCERLNCEFQMVSSVGQGQATECATAKLNGNKNRYTNVLPCKWGKRGMYV